MLLKNSQIMKVLREKSSTEKLLRKTKKDQIELIKLQGTYLGKLFDEFAEVDELLEREGVAYVVVEVPPEDDTQFERAKEEEQMQCYDIVRIAPNRHKVYARTIDMI